MAWFFVQVWVLCVVAFLLGSAVTWFAFVRPLRRDRHLDDAAWPELSAAWPARSAVQVPATPSPVLPVEATDPALSALDARGRRSTAGRAATDALERLGVGPTIPAQPGAVDRPADHRPDIPAQPGPADTAGR